jgi:hypothetical protein
MEKMVNLFHNIRECDLFNAHYNCIVGEDSILSYLLFVSIMKNDTKLGEKNETVSLSLFSLSSSLYA